jgi:hypothetical protein
MRSWLMYRVTNYPKRFGRQGFVVRSTFRLNKGSLRHCFSSGLWRYAVVSSIRPVLLERLRILNQFFNR